MEESLNYTTLACNYFVALFSVYRLERRDDRKLDFRLLPKEIRLQRSGSLLCLKRAFLLSEMRRPSEALESLQQSIEYAYSALVNTILLVMNCTISMAKMKFRRIHQIYRADNNFVLSKQDYLEIGDQASKNLNAVKSPAIIRSGGHSTFLNLKDSYVTRLKERMHSFLEMEDKEKLLRLRQLFPIMVEMSNALQRFDPQR